MNRIAEAAMRLDQSDTRLLITPPRGRIFKMAGIFLAIELFLFSITDGILGIVTVPLIFIWCYFYYYFCKIWRSYDYSYFYLVTAPALMVVLSFGVKYLIYNLF